MEKISVLESALTRQREIFQIVEKVSKLCNISNVGLVLIDGDQISQPVIKGNKLPITDKTRLLINKGFATNYFVSNPQINANDTLELVDEHEHFNFFGSFLLKSMSVGPIGLLCFYDRKKITLTKLQKNIVQLFARMICLFVDWQISQQKQTDFANEIESKNNTLREIAMIQSHDIRQPLTSIMGLIALVTNEISEPDKNWIKMMQTATDALDKKIQAIISQTMAEKDLKAIKFNRLVEEIEDYAILLIDTDGNVENWNKGAELIKGYKASEIIGQNFSVFYQPNDISAGLPQKLLAEAKANGKAVSEGWRVRKSGDRFWARVLITAIHDEHNAVIGFTKMTHNITEIKYSRDSLSKSEQINEQVAEALNDYAIVSLDSGGNIVSWNKGAQRIKGYTADEIMNKHFSIFYTLEDRQNKLPDNLLKQASATGRAYSEGWRLKKNGARFFASITITALYDSDGLHIGYTKVTKDLSADSESRFPLAI